MVFDAPLEKDTKTLQTELLIKYIKAEQALNVEQYLAFLTHDDQALTDAVDFAWADNFLCEAIKVNYPFMVMLLLNALKRSKKEGTQQDLIVLFALAYAHTNKMSELLQSYLDACPNIQDMVTTHGIAALNLAARLGNWSGINAITALCILYDKPGREPPNLHLPYLFNFAVMNKKFELATFLLSICGERKALLDQKSKENLSLLHQCLKNKNYPGLLFLFRSGADLCARQLYMHRAWTPRGDVTDCNYSTVIEIVIKNKEYDVLEMLLDLTVRLIEKNELNNYASFLKHLIDVYDHCQDVGAFNIFNKFDFGLMLRQSSEPPPASGLSNGKQNFYTAILPSLHHYYQEKNKFDTLCREQVPLIRARAEELVEILALLDPVHIRKKSILLCCYMRPAESVKDLSKDQEKRVTYATDALIALGFPIDSLKISDLIERLKEIQNIFEKDITNLEYWKKNTLREYTKDTLSHSLLLPASSGLGVSKKREIELKGLAIKLDSAGSLRRDPLTAPLL